FTISAQVFFYLHPPSSTNIYTLSLHDALPIYHQQDNFPKSKHTSVETAGLIVRIHVNNECAEGNPDYQPDDLPLRVPHEEANHRSEEHTSELQSRENLVCRLLLEKKKKKTKKK